MNPIELYIASKAKLERFLSWRSLIGQEYFGGTRGKGGQYGSVVSARCSLTIYFQEYDGAQNYHDSSTDLASFFASAAVANSKAILDHVQGQLERDVEAAKQASEEMAREILQ